MYEAQFVLDFHHQRADAALRNAGRERSARLARQAARIERWVGRSARLSERLATMARTRRLLAQ